ncbi:PREDICTED: granulocyte-macrophage colony-stimulating factor receptor subunit alpha-like [Thamnophis sirtalis]|uniref:Granulocyte-macrophage colony-stimulating factor receptor subunit alpha-like n=1 Tax=Thamnophis sirtalis TaxID=35019 RepID=A0A6I9YAJ9_9SAUR|nr:PREDICTED: granulocyte-macrophage colony-stimulating factor receptor subunit alpha-like [Thamnophis sirtalis]
MVTILGFSNMSWLIVFCSTLHITLPKEKGMNGTSVENFDCILRSYTFKNPTMNCTWNAGKNTPPDTQYFMYLAYNKATDNECPHYISNSSERHIGCYFPEVIANQYSVYITVNGSSRVSPIQSYVDTFRLHDKEQFRPPQNITVDYSLPLYYRVQWEPPPNSRKHGSVCFVFQIKDERKNTIINVTEKTYDFPKPSKYILRIRAFGDITCPISKKMNGEWSEPIEFGTDPDTFPTLPFVFAALGTIIIIVLLTLICKRNHIWEKLTDPVPQPKDIMWQHEKNVEKWMTPVPIAGESITVIEEMAAISPKV